MRRIVTGHAQQDGAGVHLVRVLGRDTIKDFDPFLMLDAFDSRNPDDYIKGFPWHPHRGIETVTYLIEGEVEHGDSLGNKGVINDGCCQWMTAGSGIIHQEMPKPSPRMLGVQLWINLSAVDKMVHPAYRDIRSSDIPHIAEEGTSVHIISGEYHGSKGAVSGGSIPTLYLDVELKPSSEWSIETDDKATLFIYIVSGSADFEGNGEYIEAKRAVLFDYGKNFYAKASPEGVRFFLLAARPFKEQVAWGGPIVMNTQEEVLAAFSEIEKGTFIKHKKNSHLDDFLKA